MYSKTTTQLAAAVPQNHQALSSQLRLPSDPLSHPRTQTIACLEVSVRLRLICPVCFGAPGESLEHAAVLGLTHILQRPSADPDSLMCSVAMTMSASKNISYLKRSRAMILYITAQPTALFLCRRAQPVCRSGVACLWRGNRPATSPWPQVATAYPARLACVGQRSRQRSTRPKICVGRSSLRLQLAASRAV